MENFIPTSPYQKIDHILNIDKYVFPLRVHYANLFGPPILIWTMTKVGTTSIARSLQSELGKYRVFGEHNINNPKWPRSVILYDFIIKKNKPVDIITCVRDPISQTISHFFHNYEYYTGDSPINPRFSTKEIMSFFLKAQFKTYWRNWFDNNIKRYLGIDIYKYPFSVEKGYLIINHKNSRILLLKAETSNSLKEKAIVNFLNIPNLKIENQNIGSNKEYSELYQKFKKEVKFPASYISDIRNTKYFNHFYSSSEINKILDRWS